MSICRHGFWVLPQFLTFAQGRLYLGLLPLSSPACWYKPAPGCELRTAQKTADCVAVACISSLGAPSLGGNEVITKFDLLLSLNYHFIHTGFREEVSQINIPRNKQDTHKGKSYREKVT